MKDVMDMVRGRLAELENEEQTGVQRLREMEREVAALQQTLLRINGASQVLREILQAVADEPEPATSPLDAAA